MKIMNSIMKPIKTLCKYLKIPFAFIITMLSISVIYVCDKIVELNKKEPKDKSCFGLLFITVFGIILTPFSILIKSWCLTVLWSWALVPIGVPAITIVTAYLFMALFQFFNMNNSNATEKANKMLKEKNTFYIIRYMFSNSLLKAPMALGMVWIVKTALIPLLPLFS